MSAVANSLSSPVAVSTSGATGLIKPTSVIINSISAGFNKLFFSSDLGLLGFLVALFVVVGLGFVILFEVGVPNIRGQMVNNVLGIGLGIGLVVLIFQQMGNTISIAGRKLDVGMIYYLVALMIVMLIFSG
jgi:hypothetical protein